MLDDISNSSEKISYTLFYSRPSVRQPQPLSRKNPNEPDSVRNVGSVDYNSGSCTIETVDTFTSWSSVVCERDRAFKPAYYQTSIAEIIHFRLGLLIKPAYYQTSIAEMIHFGLGLMIKHAFYQTSIAEMIHFRLGLMIKPAYYQESIAEMIHFRLGLMIKPAGLG